MTEQEAMKHISALKADLERIGCKVTVTAETGDEPLTVEIVCPSDVPPPSPPVDEDRSLEAFIAMIRRGNYLVLDTETTGLERGEIVELALIDAQGRTLLNERVKPVKPIPRDATRIHGITDSDVANARTWAQLSEEVKHLLEGHDLVIYNAVYDRKMMHQSAEAAGLPKTDWKTLARFWCAMEAFAEVYGDFNEYRGNYRWQKLVTAAAYYDLPIVDAHTALGDCLMTLAVIKKMAGDDDIPW